ncbi:Sex peptide receptor [Orchesella cincta]|uniref:Sex peptide receptor n=1 Tax=Orchesella cincta TaxID=48709 RepID=A0A1D2MQX0_ORCCI|nr:Sex peptide receptor [Orchesella cincta]
MESYSSYITSTVNETFLGVNDREEGTITGDDIPITIQLEYCGAGLKSFGDAYRGVHGYASLVVCLFGSIANILNLIVLTRREMINPTNIILTGLALADLLNMMEYVPYAIYMTYFKHEKTYGWAMFVLMHSNFSQVCHTISIWLNVTLAVWRYIIVAMPIKSKTVCTMQRAKYAIALGYIIVPIICIPNYLTYAVREIPRKETTSGSGSRERKYIVNLSDRANNHPVLMTTNFWLYSVVMKLIPCAILTIVSLRLIHSLMQAKKRQNLFFANRSRASEDLSSSSGSGRGSIKSSHDMGIGSDRTTKMLLAVLLLFLFTEFPQGLLGLLSGPLGDLFFRSCYMPLADLMDFFALLNSAINFILYCAMSTKFRETFSKLFWLKEMMKFGRQRGRKISQPVSV